jgi:hypothetical protein
MRFLKMVPTSLLAGLALVACAENAVGPLATGTTADVKGTSSSTTTSSTARIRIFAVLLPPAGAPFANAKGKGHWDSRNANSKRELELEIEHLPAGMTVEFFLDGVSVGSRTTNAFGEAEIEFSTQLGQSVPTAIAGVAVEIRNTEGAVLVSGSFPTE